MIVLCFSLTNLEGSRIDHWLGLMLTRQHAEGSVILVGTHSDEKQCTQDYVTRVVGELRAKYSSQVWFSVRELCLYLFVWSGSVILVGIHSAMDAELRHSCCGRAACEVFIAGLIGAVFVLCQLCVSSYVVAAYTLEGELFVCVWGRWGSIFSFLIHPINIFFIFQPKFRNLEIIVANGVTGENMRALDDLIIQCARKNTMAKEVCLSYLFAHHTHHSHHTHHTHTHTKTCAKHMHINKYI